MADADLDNTDSPSLRYNPSGQLKAGVARSTDTKLRFRRNFTQPNVSSDVAGDKALAKTKGPIRPRSMSGGR